jgi:hypothetical protein
MDYKKLILFFIIISASAYIEANPLVSSSTNPVWMEFSIGLSFDLQDKDFDIDIKQLEMNVYFQNYSGFGLGMTFGNMYGFYLSGLHLFDFFNSDYFLFPVKLKAGYYSAYNESFPGFTLSAGAKGIIKIPGEGESQMYFITDLLGSMSYYTVPQRNNSPFKFYAEIYPGFLMDASDE